MSHRPAFQYWLFESRPLLRRRALLVALGLGGAHALATACASQTIAATKPTATPGTKSPKQPMERTLIDLAQPELRGRWFSSSDAVMGGISTTEAALQKGALVFAGVIRLENNGGFSTVSSSAVTRDGDDLSGFDSIALRVKGDGKTYQLWLVTRSRRPVYVARFETRDDDAWQEIELPFASFLPENGFGEKVRGAKPYAGQTVVGYRLLISDKQVGAFSLSLAWIKALA